MKLQARKIDHLMVQLETTCGMPIRNWMWKDDAVKLARIFNAHDDLVAALKAIASCESHHPADVVAIARNALAKVEGGQ